MHGEGGGVESKSRDCIIIMHHPCPRQNMIHVPSFVVPTCSTARIIPPVMTSLTAYGSPKLVRYLCVRLSRIRFSIFAVAFQSLLLASN